MYTIVGVNFSGEFIYTQFVMRFVRENNKAMSIHRILREKPNLGKNHREEGENSLFSKCYSEFCRVRTLLKSQITVRQRFEEEDSLDLLGLHFFLLLSESVGGFFVRS